jgi:hypothetical protein
MDRGRGFSQVVLATAVALALGVSLAWAQADPSKALIGKWEGDVQQQSRGRTSADRTLVVDSAQGTSWKGHYGITGQKMGKVDGELDTTTTPPAIRFKTGGSTVELRLLDDKNLAGTIRTPGAKQHGTSDVPMRLKKVE